MSEDCVNASVNKQINITKEWAITLKVWHYKYYHHHHHYCDLTKGHQPRESKVHPGKGRPERTQSPEGHPRVGEILKAPFQWIFYPSVDCFHPLVHRVLGRGCHSGNTATRRCESSWTGLWRLIKLFRNCNNDWKISFVNFVRKHVIIGFNRSVVVSKVPK